VNDIIIKGFGCAFHDRGAICVLCGSSDRSVLSLKESSLEAPRLTTDARPLGLCEPCTIIAHWAWRQLSGEVPPWLPADAIHRIASVRVVVARRREVPKADALPASPESERWIKGPAEMNSSYEFLCVKQAAGSYDLPGSLITASAPQGGSIESSIKEASCKALEAHGFVTWPAVVETLYTAYGPRGRLVAVVLARGWGVSETVPADRPGHEWKPWPLSEHSGPMAGFYRAMETVWGLRLHKHCATGEPEDLCVHVREAARRYIALQASLKSKTTSDTSMAVAYLAAMNADERLIERMIRRAEEGLSSELAILPRTRKRPPKKGKKPARSVAEPVRPVNEESSDEEVDDEGTSPEDDEHDDEVPAEDESNIDETDESDEELDPTFVRPARPLTQE